MSAVGNEVTVVGKSEKDVRQSSSRAYLRSGSADTHTGRSREESGPDVGSPVFRKQCKAFLFTKKNISVLVRGYHKILSAMLIKLPA